MPALLLHLTALERLALEPDRLSPAMGRALGSDLEYARLGAALPELPLYGGFRGGFEGFWKTRELPRWYQLFHAREPELFGLKMAELVAAGALVGSGAGRAFVAGYFTHLCLDRRLHGLLESLVATLRLPNEGALDAHRRIEWLQALFFVREVYGSTLLGSTQLLQRFRVQKRTGPPRGLGGGLYELLRVASHEVLLDSPSKALVDGWLRGLYVHALLLASPLGRGRGLPSASDELCRALYRGPHVDLAGEVTLALDDARVLLAQVEGYMDRGVFSPRARRRFLEALPPHLGPGRAALAGEHEGPSPDKDASAS